MKATCSGEQNSRWVFRPFKELQEAQAQTMFPHTVPGFGTSRRVIGIRCSACGVFKSFRQNAQQCPNRVRTAHHSIPVRVCGRAARRSRLFLHCARSCSGLAARRRAANARYFLGFLR